MEVRNTKANTPSSLENDSFDFMRKTRERIRLALDPNQAEKIKTEILDINRTNQQMVSVCFEYLESYIKGDNFSKPANYFIMIVIKMINEAKFQMYGDTTNFDKKLEKLIIPAFKKEIDNLKENIDNKGDENITKETVKKLKDAIKFGKEKSNLITNTDMKGDFLEYLEEAKIYIQN